MNYDGFDWDDEDDVDERGKGLTCSFCERHAKNLIFKMDKNGVPYAVCRRCNLIYRLSDWKNTTEEVFTAFG